MLKFIIIGLAGFFLFKLFTNDRRLPSAQEQRAKTKSAEGGGEMTKDPVCGTFVPIDGDIRVRSGDVVYCFCSYDCRDKYIKQLQQGEAAPKESEPTPKEEATPGNDA